MISLEAGKSISPIANLKKVHKSGEVLRYFMKGRQGNHSNGKVIRLRCSTLRMLLMGELKRAKDVWKESKSE